MDTGSITEVKGIENARITLQKIQETIIDVEDEKRREGINFVYISGLYHWVINGTIYKIRQGYLFEFREENGLQKVCRIDIHIDSHSLIKAFEKEFLETDLGVDNKHQIRAYLDLLKSKGLI